MGGFSNEQQMQQTKQVTLQEENAFTFAEEVWDDAWEYAPGAILFMIFIMGMTFIVMKYWRKK